MSKLIRSYASVGDLPSTSDGAIASVAGALYVRSAGAWAALPTGPSASSSTPLVDSGSGAVGSSTAYARADHVHPAGSAVVLQNGRFRGTSPLEQWYSYEGINQITGSTSPGIDNLRAARIVIPRAETVDRFGIDVNGAAAGAVCRLGLYTSAANGYPSSLVGDSGQIDISTVTFKSVTTSLSLAPGIYWLAFLGGTAGGNLRALSNSLMFGHQGSASSQGALGISVAQSYGALPATFPAGASQNASAGNLPLALVRFA